LDFPPALTSAFFAVLFLKVAHSEQDFLLVLVLVVVLVVETKGKSEDENENDDEDDLVAAKGRATLFAVNSNRATAVHFPFCEFISFTASARQTSTRSLTPMAAR
jgi:hypothetical protein